MSIENPGPEFLKQKYDLHNSSEVKSAANRTEHRTGEKLPHDAESQIQNYLDRLKEITDRENPDESERLIGKLKDILHDRYVIKPEEIPEAYFENQREMARELGHGDIEITQEMRDQLTDVIISDQKSTLDNWVDYLSGSDAVYPDWLKYWSFRSVLTMGGYDKEKHSFSKRSKGTTKPFSDLNREALAYVLDAVSKKYQGRQIETLEGEEKEDFQRLLNSENFAKLYAWAIEKVTPASHEQLTEVEGQWIKYSQGSDPTKDIPDGFDRALVPSLQGHGTGWCTAGEQTAQTQLEGGDFYVFYSLDDKNNPTIPRAAIRMEGDQIGEVRGIAPEQNLDPYIADTVEKKLQEFPDGKAYEKRNADMKQLTYIEHKMKAGETLDKTDLIFLYEINAPIEGFGYQRDPRIQELRHMRNPFDDAPIVLDCSKEEVVFRPEKINETTKAYIGPLSPGIFDRLTNIEHIYTTFPEGKIRKSQLEIGGKSAQELEQELVENKIYVSDWAKDLLHSPDFKTLPNPEQIDLVRLKVRDFGFFTGATTSEIYARAEDLGLELCPAEVGPHQRLKDTDQKLYDYYRIAMKQISDRSGDPGVFSLIHDDGGLGLYGIIAPPDGRWRPGGELMFRLPQVSES